MAPQSLPSPHDFLASIKKEPQNHPDLEDIYAIDKVSLVQTSFQWIAIITVLMHTIHNLLLMKNVTDSKQTHHSKWQFIPH